MTTPTQAQIEAAGKVIHRAFRSSSTTFRTCHEIAEEVLAAAADVGRQEDYKLYEKMMNDPSKVVLSKVDTAAAEVGDSPTAQIFRQSIKDEVASVAKEVEARTIERCAQVAENNTYFPQEGAVIAAAIRAEKEKS